MSELSAQVHPAPGLTQDQTAPVRGTRRFSFDNRFLAPLLITCILLGGQLTYGILESYPKTLLAIMTAIAMELVLARLFTGKWPHLASAYISGISVGILVRSPALWPYMLCSMISITSKYVLRMRDRHIWNPSNFGICAMLVLAPMAVATLSVQWGNSLWPMIVIWALGSVIIWRLKRFHITATYVVSFILFAFVRSLITGHTFQAEVAPITGPMYQLFVFFMITDPKTTVRSKAAQCAVAVGVAFVETILRLMQIVHAPYYALFLVGPTANLIEIWLTSRLRVVPVASQR
jgi:Na+-translocating ferredoxin:NAD+ oxidoreductase RnfD subunit